MPWPDADGDGALARHHVSAGEHAGAAGHQRLRHPHGAVVVELHPGQVAHERRLGLLAERHDHGVGGQRLELPCRPGLAVVVEFHHLDLHFVAVERGDGAQPVDLDALAFGLLGLLLVRGHLRAGAAVDDHGVLRAEPAGHPGGVHRGVAAAVHRHPAADLRMLTRGDAAQERQRVDHRRCVLDRDVDALGQVRADGDERRVEIARLEFVGEVFDPVPAGDLHAERGDALRFRRRSTSRGSR